MTAAPLTSSEPGAPVIGSERLVLRRLRVEDAPFILELLNDPDWLRFIGDKGVKTLEDAQRYVLSGPIESYARHGFGLFAVERKPGGAPIGLCGLLKRDVLDDVDVGYAFLPEFRGRGYAREAAVATLRLAKETIGLDRVAAITNPDNARSIRILEGLGFAFEKMVRLSEDAPEIRYYARAL
ncbi:MAG TPA: GNAT family N-acetyltransferase [Thermoanaerobaculia bacterium]|nr:GNAT family N-acetyltransferase [Thermoanaerobaculia bacterium]